MRVITVPQKPRRDSVLDQQLTPAQQDDLYDRIDKGMTYAASPKFLLQEYGIELSSFAIWRWATRRRRLNNDLTFAKLLETIRADKEQALALGEEIGSAQELNEANVLMLSQALFETRRNNDQRGMAQAAKLFTSVLSAVNQTKRTEISAIAARTARDRFEFDAAQAALQHAAELHAINADSSIDQRTRIARAIERMFGAALADPPPEPTPPSEP